MENKIYDILELGRLNHLQLLEIAAEHGLEEEDCETKQETIYAILDAQAKELVSRRPADD